MTPDSRHLNAGEYVERYAGNSIRFAGMFDGPIDREMYFDQDGSFQTVDLDRVLILEGTWSVHEVLGASNLNIEFTASGIHREEAWRDQGDIMTMFVNALPDGTASMFSRSSEGAGTFTQPMPTRGFQARDRFNNLKRTIADVLDS